MFLQKVIIIFTYLYYMYLFIRGVSLSTYVEVKGHLGEVGSLLS